MIQNRCASRGSDRWTLSVLFLLTCAGSTLPAKAQAQDEDVRWTNDSELSFLLSGGNAGASTLGVRNSLRRIGASSEIRIDLAGLRTEATQVSRIAEGNGPDDFVLREERNTERTAERYSVEARYDRSLSERFFAFGSYGWTRDTFAGFERRVIASAGTGNQWGPGEEDWTLKIGYGVTYTRQRDVTPNPERADSFGGARLTLDHFHQLSESTAVEFQWVLDGNAKERDDLRGDFTQALSSSLGNRLALKTTVQFLWDNDPPLGRVPLFTDTGDPTGEELLLPLDRLDHNVSIALVLTL